MKLPHTTDEDSSSYLLKAFSLKRYDEVEGIKEDVKRNTIVILKITPLAQSNIEDLKRSLEELTLFATSCGGDIARLGEERIVVAPRGVRIWRGEKTDSSNGEQLGR